MACLKCGSSWVTRWGKDKLSCPECCKQQRAKARRLGHLSASQTKDCVTCGARFEAVGGNAIVNAKYCNSCREAKASSCERRKRYTQRVKAGSVVPQKRCERHPAKHCHLCNKALKKSQAKYCSNACFVAARKAGVQRWDRTNQTNALLNRCGISTTPSRLGLSRVLSGLSGFMAKLKAFQHRISRLHCPVCNAFVNRVRSRFCSEECASRFEFLTTCSHCGCSTIAKGHRGSKRRVCKACREKSEREVIRRHRLKYGKNHRSRARHHGVKYVSFPLRTIYERDGYRCQICKKRVFQKARYRKTDGKIHPMSPTIDHIVPMSRGGNHEPDNCQTACFLCNSRKSDLGGGQLRLAITASPSQ